MGREKIKASIKRSRVFEIASKSGRNVTFSWWNFTIQCFYHAGDDMCVHKD